jgi:HAMP domain-containing protein
MLASTSGLTRFARNTQAVAVTVALGLSLLAAFFFLRPLQRVVQTAQSLAQGDLAARTGLATDDEVGEAGRAIDAMAVDLRRRLANAGSGDAVLAQLVGALPLPCLVFDVSGEILAQNANGRRALLLDGPRSSRRIRELIAAPAWQSAVDAAERDGEPFPVSVLLDDGHRVDGHVHLLKRPGASPLILLVSTNTIQETTTSLPGPETVRSMPLSEVLASARARLNGELEGVTLEIGDSPAVLVAEADGRVVKAVARVLSSCARATGAGNTLCINVTIEDTRGTRRRGGPPVVAAGLIAPRRRRTDALPTGESVLPRFDTVPAGARRVEATARDKRTLELRQFLRLPRRMGEEVAY